MSSVTPNFGFILPSVADPTDADLWGGMLNSNFTLLDTLLTDFAEKLPVGSLYYNADVATNPATLLGYGTWVAFGAGRVIIGVGTGTDANGVMEIFANGDTGGEYEHTLTIAEMAEHRHVQGQPDSTGGSYYGMVVPPDQTSVPVSRDGLVAGLTSNLGYNTSLVGDDEAHNNIQPYISVYVWRRSS